MSSPKHVVEPRPVSTSRWILGTVLTLGYSGLMGAAVTTAAIFRRRYRPVAAFHRRFFMDVAKDLLLRRDIHIRRFH